MGTKVLIVDDTKLMREGIKNLLGSKIGFRVIGEAADGEEAVELARKLKPNLIIIETALPLLNGVEAARQITARDPDVKVIALSRQGDGWLVTRMLQAGAVGYLVKSCGFDELKLAIHLVLKGEVYVSPAVSDKFVSSYMQKQMTNKLASLLSNRESEVLKLLAEGRTTKETASLLYIGEDTVSALRQNIMDKLEMHSIAELTKFAVREGITTLDG
ncbi:MAG: response regulator transcription factor [Candidatus Latescibacterota bacterium]